MIVKKPLAVAVILLFIGVAFAPCINANEGKDMVEFTTEVCGLNGGKQTVKLTQEEAVEVEALFESIRERLNATETRGEAEEIFREAVVELDKYGLLGGLSVKQAQMLVTGGYQDSRDMNLIEKLSRGFSYYKSCLVLGYVNFGMAVTLVTMPFIFLFFLFGALGVGSDILFGIAVFWFLIGFITLFLRNPIPGPQLPCLFWLGLGDIANFLLLPEFLYWAGGNTLIITPNEKQFFQKEYIGWFWGFTGLRFRFPINHYFIGYTPYATMN